MEAAMKALVVVGSLLLAGCGARGLQDGKPPGVLDPADAPAAAWLAYADDGVLIAATRKAIVRFDTALNEIDRAVPPLPFDRDVRWLGQMYFSASRDGRVAALSWQSTFPEPPAAAAGGVVFALPSAAPIRLDTYADAPTFEFQGLSVSPDGQTTAAIVHPEIRVTAVDDGRLLWRADKPFVSQPPFSLALDALVVASDDAALEVVGARDGAPLLTIAAPMWHWYDPVAVSADGSTVAAVVAASGVVAWRLSDGSAVAAAPFPADVAGIPRAITLSPHGDMIAASAFGGAGGSGAAVLVWQGDQLLFRVDGETDALAFSPDGGTLAVASPQHGVQLLRATDGALLAQRSFPR
jgi:hypothetical protein